MRLPKLTERVGIDLHDGRFGQGIRAHELVVGRVEDDADDAHFACHALAAPGEVAGVETQGAEFAVAAAGAHEMDAFAADTGVGRLTTFLEGSVLLIRWVGQRHFGLCIPLLAIVCALTAGGGALVTGVTRDTAMWLAR